MITKSIKSRLLKVSRLGKKHLGEAEIKLFQTLHKLRNLVKGKKPEHIVICGPASSGITLMHNMLRYSIDDKNVAIHLGESPALASLKLFENGYVTKKTVDLHSVNEIRKRLSDIRDLKFLIMVRDPRALVTSMCESIPWQYIQSWDYGFSLDPYPSFTRPGAGKAFDQIDAIKQLSNVKYKIVRYEDLVEFPERIHRQLLKFIETPLHRPFQEFFKGRTPKNPTLKLNEIHPPDKKNVEHWRDPKYKNRIETMLYLFPEMKDRIAEYGYPEVKSAEEIELKSLEYHEGTVVAMHTPDDVYSNEARRMQASLDRLGINHSIDELPCVEKIAGAKNPENYPDWFIQKLARYYKPTWLKQKREQLRGPILYCDVDAFFHKNPWPYLSLYDGDIAVFRTYDGYIISSTIWLNDNASALKILELWEKQCKLKRLEVFNSWPDVIPSTSDQPILKNIVHKNDLTNSFHIQQIPPTMLHIFDHNNDTSLDDVIIEQLQASRVAKTWRNKDPLTGMTKRDKRISELELLLAEN